MKEYENVIKTNNCQCWKDGIVFVSSEMNMVIRYNTESSEISFIPPPGENMFGKGLYGIVDVYDSQLYLFPFAANNIWKYDNNKWECVRTDLDIKGAKFLGSFRRDHSIYLFGYSEARIYKFDYRSNTMTKLKFNGDQLDTEAKRTMGCFGVDHETVDGIVYYPLMCDNKVISLNPDNDEIRVLDVPSRSSGYTGIVYDKRTGFWLAPRMGRYYVNYTLDGDVTEYELPGDYCRNEFYFGEAHRKGEEVVFYSFCARNFAFNISNNELNRTFLPSILYKKTMSDGRDVYTEPNGEVLLFDMMGNERPIHLNMGRKEKACYLSDYLGKEFILTENKDITLDEYIDMLKYG